MHPAVELLSDVAVSPNLARHESQVACAYPFSCRLSNGDLVCVYRRGRDKHSRDGVLVGHRSTDGGANWSEPIVIYDGMGKAQPESVHAGVVCQLFDGSLLAMFKTVEAKDHGEFIFSKKGRQLRQQLHVSRSSDGGHSWMPAETNQFENAPRDHYVGTRPLLLPGGELFLTVEATVDGKEITLGTSSPDGGDHWAPLWACAHDESGAQSYGDPRLALLPDGRIVMLLWTWANKTDETLEVHRLVSHDRGRTWARAAPPEIGREHV